MAVDMKKDATDHYVADDGHSMQREHGFAPNGNELGGQWVLRGPAGGLIDFDAYRTDLAERNNMFLTN